MSDPRRQTWGEAEADGAALLALLQREAAGLGISRLAVANPERRPDPAVLDTWLAAGLHGSMTYLERHRDLRLDPDRLLPGVRSIVCVALAYASGDLTCSSGELAPASGDLACSSGELAPALGDPEDADRRGAGMRSRASQPPRVSRYALGRDYHHVLRRKLEGLVARARERRPRLRARIAVDTAPVLERHWAVASGLGWWGKHGCVIAPGLGSWVFLGEIFLDAPLPPGAPLPPRCGDCDRCLRACPTGALVAPGRLDARRCIAYWTVEHRGEFPPEAPQLSPWIFGCDRCQEVCPWNRDTRCAVDPELAPYWPERPEHLDGWLGLGEAEFKRYLKPTPMERAGLTGLLRNARRLTQEAGDAPVGSTAGGREP